MAEIPTIVKTWIDVEMTDEEIAKLKDDILLKVHNENRVELTSFHGFLQLKDRMWVGKVKRLAPGSDLLEALKPDKGPVEIYIVEVHHKVMEEIDPYVSAEKLDWGVAVFAMSLSTSKEELILQNFASYFVAVYGEMPRQASMKRPQILGLGSKLQSIITGGTHTTLKAVWSVKAEVFTAVLRDRASLVAEFAIPSGYEIRELSLKETLYAADHWKYKTDSVTYRFATSCVNGFVFGAFPIGGTDPVSWAYASWDGAISALQTKEGHKKKGLAKEIVKLLSLKLIENGVIPCAYVEDIMEGSNIPAALFSSLGFEVHKDVKFHWSFPCCRTCRN